MAACTPKDDATTVSTTVETPEDSSSTTVEPEAQTTGEATTTTGQATTTTGQDSSTGELSASCECVAPAPCSVSLCPLVFRDENEEESGGPDDDVELAAALTCALEAMRDGKAGAIDWRLFSGAPTGIFSRDIRFEMFGDRTALRTYNAALDLCVVVDDVTVGPLQSAQFFDDCLAEADLTARFECVENALAPAPEVCKAPEERCDGV